MEINMKIHLRTARTVVSAKYSQLLCIMLSKKKMFFQWTLNYSYSSLLTIQFLPILPQGNFRIYHRVDSQGNREGNIGLNSERGISDVLKTGSPLDSPGELPKNVNTWVQSQKVNLMRPRTVFYSLHPYAQKFSKWF